MDNAASCRPFTAKVRFRSRSVRVRLMVWESGAEAGFFSSNFRRRLSLSFRAPIFHSHLNIIGVLPEGQAGIALEPWNKALFCWLSVSTGQSSILTLCVEIKCQLDATEVFIADLIACSTCFGHHYAHHQELKSIIQWLLPVIFRAVVFEVAGLVWSWGLCVRFEGCWFISTY